MHSNFRSHILLNRFAKAAKEMFSLLLIKIELKDLLVTKNKISKIDELTNDLQSPMQFSFALCNFRLIDTFLQH